MKSNYEIDLALLTEGVRLKPCDFEEPETKQIPRSGRRHFTRREAEEKIKKKNKIRTRIRARKLAKREHDGEMFYIYRDYKIIAELHDSEIWKPTNKKGREQKRGGVYYG